VTIVDLGETYSSDVFEVRDAAGVLAAAGTVTCDLTFPDATTAAPFAVPSIAVGRYAFDFTPVGPQIQAGTHPFTITATGGALGSLLRKWTDSYDVDLEAPLISTRAAIRHLRGQDVIVGEERIEELRWLCSSTSAAVEGDLGRVLARRAVVERHDGGRGAIVLRRSPVASVTSVVESGTTLTGGSGVAWVLDEVAPILYAGGTDSPRQWTCGRQNVVVTYVAGYVDPPRVARSVALNVVAAMWQESQQSSHPLLEGGDVADEVFSAVESLSAVERSAYERLRTVGLA